jgi:hypothetical protein
MHQIQIPILKLKKTSMKILLSTFLLSVIMICSTSAQNKNLSCGTIGTDQTIEKNSTPAKLISLVAPKGATSTFAYQWQSSTDGKTWSNIPNAIGDSYAPGVLSVSTFFRREVTSSNTSCTTNMVKITVK